MSKFQFRWDQNQIKYLGIGPVPKATENSQFLTIILYCNIEGDTQEMGCLSLLRKIGLLDVCPLQELLCFLIMLLKNKKKRDHVRYCFGLIFKKKILRVLKVCLIFFERKKAHNRISSKIWQSNIWT